MGRRVKGLGILVAVLAAALARPAAAETVVVYSGALDQVAAHDNGFGKDGQFLVMGTAPDLSGVDDTRGVWFPFLPNWYGNSTAGTFGVRVRYDGRIPGGATITKVELRTRIRAATASGNRVQFMAHRDLVGDEWGELNWNTNPLYQTPYSPPCQYGGPCWTQQDQWTDFVAVLPFDGLRNPWTVEGIYNNCFGVWALPAIGGGIYMSKWELRVTYA